MRIQNCSFRALVAAVSVSVAMSFGISPDTFHLVQTAAATFSHQASHFGVDLLHRYQHSLSEFPLQTKMATGATLAVAGDAIAQSRNEDPYDTRRAASFAVFDSSYRALQHVAFPVIIQHCHGQYLAGLLAAALPFLHLHMGQTQSYAAAMEQTLASQLGIVPFLYYPAFFTLTGVMQGLDFDATMQRAKENFLPLMQRNLLFWIPVQFVQFGFVQQDLQIPFLSACGLAWTFILSITAGSAKKYSSPTTSEEVEELLANAATQSIILETSEQETTRQEYIGGKLANLKA